MKQLHSLRNITLLAVALLCAAPALVATLPHAAFAQNNATGSGNWSDTTIWSTSLVPDRQDGVAISTTTVTGGQTVQITGGATVTIDGTSNHGSGILQWTGGTFQPAAGAGTGYVDTGDDLNLGVSGLGDGTINMSGQVQLDVGMHNGGNTLVGAGTPETAANSAPQGTNGGINQSQYPPNDSQLSNVTGTFDGARDSAYRDISFWHERSDPVDNQLYVPTDPYSPVHAAQSTAGQTTATELPLYDLGGFLNIGHTGAQTGTFDMDGGVLNVVQYGWTWATGNNVDWEAGGPDSNFNNNTMIWTGTTDALPGESRWEGYRLDDDLADGDGDGIGGWEVDPGTTLTADDGTSYMFVDVSELQNAYYHTGDSNENRMANIFTAIGSGNNTYPFPDPPIASVDWDNSIDGNPGPFGDETATAPAGMTDPDADGVAAAVDYYHQIGRSGGNIRIGNADDSVGYFNITDGLVTTNNFQIARLEDSSGNVSQTGGDVFLRENINIATDTSRTNGAYNFGNTTANGMDATTAFTNATGDGGAQYYGRTSTGLDRDGTDPTTQFAPTPDGGGVLEIARDLQVGNVGQGVFNLNSGTTFTFTDPDTQATSTRTSYMVVGDDIRIAQAPNAYGVFNFDSPIDIVASDRQWRSDTQQNIVIGQLNSPASNAVGIFNYNPLAGEIGSTDAALAQTSTGYNEFDAMFVGSGTNSTGYFNHNNHHTIFLDSHLTVGWSADSPGVLNLLGQPEAASYTPGGLDAANDYQGGIDADLRLVVGDRGIGVVNQTGETSVAVINQTPTAPDPTNYRDIMLGRFDESTDPGTNNGSIAFTDTGSGSGEYNFGLPDSGDPLVESQVLGASMADAGSNNLGTPNTPTITARNLLVGEGGDGVFNYYADTPLLNVDNRIDVGVHNTATGVFNIVSDVGVEVRSGDGLSPVGSNLSDTGKGRTGEIAVGEGGLGYFNQGTFDTNNTGKTPDGTTGQNSLVNTQGSDLVVGGANRYHVDDRENFSTIMHDSGEGHYNLNGNGASIDLGGATLRIGTGDNIQEGVMMRDDNGNQIAQTSNVSIGTNNRTVVRDIRDPWSTTGGSWLSESGETDNVPQGTGTAFGTANTWTTENPVTDEAGNAIGPDFDMFAGPEDGEGSLGIFNHNNDRDVTYGGGGDQLVLGDGDNAQGLYSQNGTGDVTMASDLSMSADNFDTGDATLDPTTSSASQGFEMGQSTWSINNADAVLDLAGNNVTGDSVDVAGRGAEVLDTFDAGGGMTNLVKGTLLNRANEAHIGLYLGGLLNTREVNADIVQYGGTFEMSASNTAAGVTTDLSANDHDFIQFGAGTDYTDPLYYAMANVDEASKSAVGGTALFDLYDFSGALASVDDLVNNPGNIPFLGGGGDSDTLIADYLELGGTVNVTLDDNFTIPYAAGQFWNLLDWSTDFDDTPVNGMNAGNQFNWHGILNLPVISDPGLAWSTTLWESHGIIAVIPEPSRALLILLGLAPALLMRRRPRIAKS